MRAWMATMAVLAGAAALPARGDGVAALQPYTARYEVTFRGISGGEIESSFSRGGADGQWKYQTRVFPSLLARMAISPQATESSTMLVTPDGVRPLSFVFNDGSSGVDKDVRLAYDWNSNKVTGSNGGKPVAIDLLPGTHDTASVQAAMILERLAGRKPTSFRIITDGKLREYRYWQEGTQQVMTPYGKVDTEIWASQRNGSTRVSKVWHAPSLGYVPVQAVQYRKGKAETHMNLVQLKR
jgi:Protein of unknown function (DUF3108)